MGSATWTGQLLQNRYRIESQLSPDGDGNGAGMSRVYRGADTQLADSPVAIKFLRSEWTGQEEHKLFEKEISHLIKLKGHANIVELVGQGNADKGPYEGVPYIVFEYMPMGDLSNDLFMGSAIDKFLRMAIDICDGLQFAHSQKVLHRDVKPENLFVARDGTVKVGDFGISTESEWQVKEYGPGDSKGRGPYGTDGYASPQLGVGLIHQESDDVFSAGVVFYRQLTGEFPYSSKRLREDKPEPPPKEPKALNKGVSANLSKLILKMVAWKREDRHKDFAVIRAELHQEQIRRANDRADVDTYLATPSLQRIRTLVRDKVARTVRHFVERTENNPLHPRAISDESKDWYVNVFLRVGRENRNDMIEMSPGLHCIYSAHAVRDRVVHATDWVTEFDLVTRPVPITSCCSGLPVRLLADDDDEVGHLKRWMKTRVSDDGRLDLVTITELRRLRSARDDNPVQRCYLPTLGNGLLGVDGVHQIHKDIDTVILCPLYDPLRSAPNRAADQIVGVVNFEWVAALQPPRIDAIAAQIRRWIVDERRFPVSSFISQVLQLATELSIEGDSATVR